MAKAIINLESLRSNVRRVRQLAPNSLLLAVVKANAYGHGMVPISRTLAPLVDGFAVARLGEALALRKAGIGVRIVLLSEHAGMEQLQSCSTQQIDIVIHDIEGAARLAEAGLENRLSVWLKVDTGMHRLGIEPEQLTSIYAQLEASPCVSEVVLMSHLSSAEEIKHPANERQIHAFGQVSENIPASTSLANSAAILSRPETHRDWVRPGIMLYGANPLGERAKPKLDAVMTLLAPLLAVREVTAGDGVGYNQAWIAPKSGRIGTVAIGYGDGYPRHAPNGTPVLINGRRAALAGRVSMDTITIDLSEHPDAMPGDTVQLWGAQLPVNEIADHAGTIAYELLTRVTNRVTFYYEDD